MTIVINIVFQRGFIIQSVYLKLSLNIAIHIEYISYRTVYIDKPCKYRSVYNRSTDLKELVAILHRYSDITQHNKLSTVIFSKLKHVETSEDISKL
jgi:hypothetical protein